MNGANENKDSQINEEISLQEEEATCDLGETRESLALKKAIEEKNEYINLAQRVQADFENYKKRNRNSIMEACQTTVVETAAVFIPVLDNIERCLESFGANSPSDDGIIKGIDLVAKQFKDVLRQLDVFEIEALNKEFDPNLHNAIANVESDDEAKNVVVEVLQKGYRCKDKIIRHSLVKVSS